MLLILYLKLHFLEKYPNLEKLATLLCVILNKRYNSARLVETRLMGGHFLVEGTALNNSESI